jgi:hypothetical protein
VAPLIRRRHMIGIIDAAPDAGLAVTQVALFCWQQVTGRTENDAQYS